MDLNPFHHLGLHLPFRRYSGPILKVLCPTYVMTSRTHRWISPMILDPVCYHAGILPV